MAKQANISILIDRARNGGREATKTLVEGIRPRLFEYVNRLTLDADLAHDIVQDSVITMMEQLPSLENNERFWPWLSTIALNKTRRYYRDNGRHQASLDRAQAKKPTCNDHDAVADAITHELRQIVLEAMRQLKTDLRTVLVLRSYEQLSFREIAERTGTSEFRARALFVRAKRALGKGLARKGYGKSSLLGALVVFGKLTATSEVSLAEVSISTATVEAGLLPVLSVLFTQKATLLILAAAGTVSALSPVMLPSPAPDMPMAYHPAVQRVQNTTHRHWFYYPPGSVDTVLIQVRSVDKNGNATPLWLQNEHANFRRRGDSVQICNARLWQQDGSVMRLPTDSPALTAFLDRTEGRSGSANPVRLSRDGLLVTREAQGPWRILQDFDATDQRCYSDPWPPQLHIVDQRDALHKRGWTTFTIKGDLRGQTITGNGSIPLVPAQRQAHGPWIQMHIGQQGILTDNGGTCLLTDARGHVTRRFQGGTCFSGLMRPWQGLHTIDTIRRDAALAQIPFETEWTTRGTQAVVHVHCETVEITYDIDMLRDLITEIHFTWPDRSEGLLRFTYGHQLSRTNAHAIEPPALPKRRSRGHTPGITWLTQLAEGMLGQ